MFDWVTFGHLRIHSEQAAVLDSCLSRVGPMQFTFAHQLAHNLVAPWDNNSAAQIPTFIPNSLRTLGNSIYKSQDLIETHIHRGLSKVTVKTLFPEYDLFNQPDDSNRLVVKGPFEIFEQTVCAAQCAYQLKVKRSGVLVWNSKQQNMWTPNAVNQRTYIVSMVTTPILSNHLPHSRDILTSISYTCGFSIFNLQIKRERERQNERGRAREREIEWMGIDIRIQKHHGC